jgi:hypothetical protein
MTVALALDPEIWGTDIEVCTVGGFIAEANPNQPVRLLICTSAHADRSEAGFGRLGLARELDLRPVLYKALQAR